MSQKPENINLSVPIGTQIVIRSEIEIDDLGESYPAGSVGLVVNAPMDHTKSYRVRLTDGSEIDLRREQFSTRKQHQRGALDIGSAPQESALPSYIIYRCIVGSRAYGLDHEASDTDLRGIYLPPAEMHWSLNGVPEQLENKDNEECYWELQKFLTLALKANPNILECLYTPLIETVTPLAEELLAMRSIFLSKLVYQTYNGYVMSQFKKLEQDVRTVGVPRPKHAMHLIRLLSAGVTVLRDEYVPVRIDSQRESLLAIRNNEMPWEEVNEWRLRLHKEFDEAFAKSRLPDRPNVEKANAFLIKARRSMVGDI
jgi:predicted nucleotidyltransferase